MDPRWVPWGANSSAVCTWPSNLPISIPSCSCVEVSNCTGHIAFESTQEFVVALQRNRSVFFDICDAQGAPNAPSASLRGKSARVYYGRCPNGSGWYAAFDSSYGAGNYVMSLSGKANGTLSIWNSNQSLPLWPNSTAATAGWSTFVIPATSSARAVEAASSDLVVEYIAYGMFNVLRSKAAKFSADDAMRAISLGGVLLGPSLGGDGYATFGTGIGAEAVLVIARGDGTVARRVLQSAGVLLWSPPHRASEGAVNWAALTVITIVSFIYAILPRRSGVK